MLLKSSRFDVNTHYADGNTVFSRALASVTVMEMIIVHGKGYPKAVTDTMGVLATHGFDFRFAKRDNRGYVLDALFFATYYERTAWVQYLLTTPTIMQTLDINRPNGIEQMTALHQSIHDHRKTIFKLLLAAGADPALTCTQTPTTAPEFHTPTTTLHLAAQQSDPTLYFLPRLLGYPLDINAADLWGATPLSIALREGNLHLAAHLLRHGADIDLRTGPLNMPPNLRTTILGDLLQSPSELILTRLQFLLCSESRPTLPNNPARHGPRPNFYVGGTRGSTALHVFLRHNDSREPIPFSSCLSTLLTAYPDPDEHINAIDPEMNRQTPLHIAAANADPTAVKMLLDAGADAGRRDAEGRTAGEVVGGRMKGEGEMEMQKMVFSKRVVERRRGLVSELLAAAERREGAIGGEGNGRGDEA